jgi:hypothetical protein
MNIIGGRAEAYDTGHRKLNDAEIKELFVTIKLNTHFSLPERLVQDFIQDGSIKPTFKKCVHFNKEDLQEMIQPLKKKKQKRKRIPKKTKKKDKKENKKDKKDKKKTEKEKTKKQ